MIINAKGEIISIKITQGNIDDRKAFEDMVLTKNLTGKCYGDKGYISRSLFNRLYRRGLNLITGIKRNMKNYLLPIFDKIMLRKRFIIETIFGYVKEQFNIKPQKHRLNLLYLIHSSR